MAEETAAAGATTENTPAAEPATLLTEPIQDAEGSANAGAETTQTNEATKAPEGDNKASGAEAGTGDDPAKTDPEALEVTIPEGFTVDEAVIADYKALATKHGLTKEAAQEGIEMFAKVQAANTEAQQKAWSEQQIAWMDEVKNDPTFGGKNLNNTLKHAQSVIARYGDDQLKAELKAFGIGNLPSLVRMLAKAGKDMSEDSIVGQGGAAGAVPIEVAMYPTMTKK